MNGKVRIVGLQWHVRCEDHTLSELSALAADDVPALLERMNLDQVSEPRWELRNGEYGELFLEATLDVLPHHTRAAR